MNIRQSSLLKANPLTLNTQFTNFQAIEKSCKPIRVDVLNKTVIRSLKKYYTQLFEAQNSNYEQETSDVKMFEELTHNFTLNLFKFLHNELNQEGILFEDILFTIRMLIQPEITKKTSKTREQRFLMNDYYDCIYKYSHKRLLKLCKNSTFTYLFTKFISLGLFREQVMNDQTLMQNPVAYLEAGEKMLQLFGN